MRITISYIVLQARHPSKSLKEDPSSQHVKYMGNGFATDEYTRDLKESFDKIKKSISIAQQKQKQAGDKHHRRELFFKEDD